VAEQELRTLGVDAGPSTRGDKNYLPSPSRRSTDRRRSAPNTRLTDKNAHQDNDVSEVMPTKTDITGTRISDTGDKPMVSSTDVTMNGLGHESKTCVVARDASRGDYQVDLHPVDLEDPRRVESPHTHGVTLLSTM